MPLPPVVPAICIQINTGSWPGGEGRGGSPRTGCQGEQPSGGPLFVICVGLGGRASQDARPLPPAGPTRNHFREKRCTRDTPMVDRRIAVRGRGVITIEISVDDRRWSFFFFCLQITSNCRGYQTVVSLAGMTAQCI